MYYKYNFLYGLFLYYKLRKNVSLLLKTTLKIVRLEPTVLCYSELYEFYVLCILINHNNMRDIKVIINYMI